MSMEMLLVAAICLLVGFLVGYLAASRRADSSRWVRPASTNPVRTDANLPSPTPAQGHSSSEKLSPDAMSEARALLLQGKKISAIKLVREATGLGLKESKDLVESWTR